jgi:hypothetical protein
MPKPGHVRIVSNSEKPSTPPAVLPASKVRLVNRETNETSVFYIVDAIEILNAPGSIYGLVEGTNYPDSFLRRIGLGTDEPPEAA